LKGALPVRDFENIFRLIQKISASRAKRRSADEHPWRAA
jgi:hypothetical protein